MTGAAVDGVTDHRMQEILRGERLPTSLEYALIADASGWTVDWLLHGTERSTSVVVCRASDYASLADTYEGSSLCGCPDCIEYVAERESEDEV
ncbi:hypothetical protein [Streptomyces sp. NPDC058855]|uniref:hypothetical protein n=1 Tax=Streptomyces sp. NPDC058855 TaxID=3346651 RepID=UPI0036849425